MRWVHQPAPKDGDWRTETFFAWRPIRVGYETRWLDLWERRQAEWRFPPATKGDGR